MSLKKYLHLFIAPLVTMTLTVPALAKQSWPPEANDMPTLRVARPTNDMDKVLKFYRDGLGFEVIYKFNAHLGFNGVMLGKKGAPYHFEFTQKMGHQVPAAPSQDNLIVFYLPDATAYQAALNRMKKNGFKPVTSFNPYWDRGGVTFEDFEGYRVVFYNNSWPM